VVLAVGSGATAALSAVQGGLPALGPAIQETFELSLVEVTAVFTAFALGTVVTLLAWGALSDRAGERWVIAGGLGAGSLGLALAASADGYAAFLAAVLVAGVLDSSAISASGRAVFGWFPRDERGLALGLRQTAGRGAPPLQACRCLHWRRRPGWTRPSTRFAGAMLTGSVTAALWLREGERRESAGPPPRPRSATRALAAQPDVVAHDHRPGGTSQLVLYLYGERGWPAADAALALGGVQIGAAVARAAAGRWPDLRDEWIEPFSRLARPRRTRCCSRRPRYRALRMRSPSPCWWRAAWRA
jgi:Major Facilitator Superfamily